MADLFSGLGGLMKGLSNFMPQDDPNTKLLKLQGEVADLKKQETNLYTEIGKKAVEQYGLDSFGELAEKLKLILSNLDTANKQLADEQKAAEEREKAKKEALAERTCLQCGNENPEGTNFCQECGTKLSVLACCPSCGAEVSAGIKFCQECGTKLQSNASVICQSCGNENLPGTRFCGDCGFKLEV